MAFCIRLELDHELPLMVWSDVVLLYLRDYVFTSNDRMVRATENRVQYLVNRAVCDTRAALVWSGERVEPVRFRQLVCDTLHREYGFLPMHSAQCTILREELAP